MKEEELKKVISLFDEFETNPLKKKKTFSMLMMYVDQVEPMMEELKALNKVVENMSSAVSILIKENTALKAESQRERERARKISEENQKLKKVIRYGRS